MKHYCEKLSGVRIMWVKDNQLRESADRVLRGELSFNYWVICDGAFQGLVLIVSNLRDSVTSVR